MALLIRNSRMPDIKHRPHQFEQGKSITIPAPYGGLNLRDDITALQKNEARVLTNWFPTNGQLSVRPGNSSFATGIGSGEVKTLAAFVGFSASAMLAAGGGKIYDASAAGAATELASGFSDDRWQTALYNNRLFWVNGTDNPQVYDGSTVAGIVWAGAGLTDNDLINIALVRNRLWFCEKNKADVWYGDVGQITAASNLTKFQLSQIAGGGICMAIGSWSRDAGDGADDFTVFIMSTGEILIYQGDPATTFALVGKYYTGAAPIGRQCTFKVGGELVIITRLGYLPVSAAISMPPGKALDLSSVDPWGKIAPGIVTDAAYAGSNGGWNGTVHLGAIYGNVPLSSTSSKQWVLNTRTAAWTNFTAWPASCFCSFGNELYFGAKSGGKVFKVTGATDNGTAITALANGAFVYPTAAQNTNLYTAARLRLQADGTVTGLIGVDTDFVIRTLSGEAVDFSDSDSGSAWETSPWETTDWGMDGASISRWYTITGNGKSVSPRLSLTSSAGDVRWFAVDVLWKPGGVR